MSAISPDQLADWRSFVGREHVETQFLDTVALRRFLLVLGEDIDGDITVVPEMGHWAYFLPMTSNRDIGADGHLRRGGFMPPVTLPRRMFAAGATRFLAPLAVGHDAACITRIADVAYKSGRSGDLVFVELERTFSQHGQIRAIEAQTIVYREAGGTIPAVARTDLHPADAPVWTPGPVDLFRFSAVTFNAHRIHYDEPYARGEEGYPGLVVHGPLTASMLCRLAARTGRDAGLGRMTGFQFRATAPLFSGQPIRLRASIDGNVVETSARRQDGVDSVSASATFDQNS